MLGRLFSFQTLNESWDAHRIVTTLLLGSYAVMCLAIIGYAVDRMQGWSPYLIVAVVAFLVFVFVLMLSKFISAVLNRV